MPPLSTDYDIFIIGGGVNGCGIARDAAGRGFSVALCEMNDLGWATSSGSTKLIHGGLRYLEYYEFLLVRKALTEREILWAAAPHIIEPLRLVLPHHRGLRPAWLLRLGLYLYDHLGGRRKLPPTRTLNLANDEVGRPLKPLFSKGFEFSDCRVDDTRLVILNALDAADRGADIMTRTRCKSAVREKDHWQIVIEDTRSGKKREITAGLLVNAAGPWVDEVLSLTLGRNDADNVRHVQGSHIVVKKLYDHDRCYLFQNQDNRIVFAIPYHDDYTLIGTTDHDFEGDPGDARATAEEISYLCASASEYFKQPVLEENVVWTYSGVRPLYDDGASKAQEATRDYVLRPDGGEDEPLLLNIFGGKITTYRVLAEAVMDGIEERFGARKPAWTSSASLPGGDFPIDGFDAFLASVRKSYPFLEEKQARRMAHAYGTKIHDILQGAVSLEDLGSDLGCGLTGREVAYLMAEEWAETADDVVWRRSKRGIAMSEAQIAELQAWMDERGLEKASVAGTA